MSFFIKNFEKIVGKKVKNVFSNYSEIPFNKTEDKKICLNGKLYIELDNGFFVLSKNAINFRKDKINSGFIDVSQYLIEIINQKILQIDYSFKDISNNNEEDFQITYKIYFDNQVNLCVDLFKYGSKCDCGFNDYKPFIKFERPKSLINPNSEYARYEQRHINDEIYEEEYSSYVCIDPNFKSKF